MKEIFYCNTTSCYVKSIEHRGLEEPKGLKCPECEELLSTTQADTSIHMAFFDRESGITYHPRELKRF